MFQKDNYINSLWDLCKQTLQTQFPEYNVDDKKLNKTDIPEGEYHILLLFPRTSQLRFSGETYNSEKKKMFRIDIFLVGRDDFAATFLAGKVDDYISHNQYDFSKFGLEYVKLSDIVKVADSKIFNSGEANNISAYVATLSGNIYL